MAAARPRSAALGRRGLAVDSGALIGALGSVAALRKLLERFEVTEKQAFAAKRLGARPTTMRAHRRAGDAILLPPRAAAALAGVLRITAANGSGGPDAPFPEPRRLAPEACAFDAEDPGMISDEQAVVIDALVDALRRRAAEARAAVGGGAVPAAVPGAAAYLELPPGRGKTRVAAAVVAGLGVPGLVVVPTLALQQQTVAEVRTLLPGARVLAYSNAEVARRAGRVATVCRRTGAAAAAVHAERPDLAPPGPATYDIVVAVRNTVCDKGPEFFAGFGAAVFDEVHEFTSPMCAKILERACGLPYLLGMSATPFERADTLDRFPVLYLGRPFNPLDAGAPPDGAGAKTAGCNWRGRVREIAYRGAYGADGAAGAPLLPVQVIGEIARDPARLGLVVGEVVRLLALHEDASYLAANPACGLGPRPPERARAGFPAGEVRRHAVIVFAEHREFLVRLRDALAAAAPGAEVAAPELDPGAGPADAGPADATILRGGATQAAIAASQTARVILTTYGYSRRGLSLKHITAVVLSTPRRNWMSQIVGRAERRGSDDDIERVVVDIVDVGTPLAGQVRTRRRAYEKKGYVAERIAL